MSKQFLKKMSATKIRTCKVRLSYPHLFHKRIDKDTQEETKYGCSLLIPKEETETIQMIREIIESKKSEALGSIWGGKIPSGFKTNFPLKDGDQMNKDAEELGEEPDPNYAGVYVINPNSQDAPGVRVLENGAVRQPKDEHEVYAGCYGVAVLNFFSYSKGKGGVGVAINSFLKVEDGDKLSSMTTADDDYADLDETADDFLN